jgi:hypothetical protein
MRTRVVSNEMAFLKSFRCLLQDKMSHISFETPLLESASTLV